MINGLCKIKIVDGAMNLFEETYYGKLGKICYAYY